MAKSAAKQEARKLRKEGCSILDISKKLSVSKSSVSLWCRDIELSLVQIQRLHASMVAGSLPGRLLGSEAQKKKRIERQQEAIIEAQKEFSDLKNLPFFFLGLGLYWGEGDKKAHIRFFNSDPEVIKVMIVWFQDILEAHQEDFMVYLNLNEAHKKRIPEIIEYWSFITGIPKNQFRKPSLVKVAHKKTYDNPELYKGTLCVAIAKSRRRLYKVLEWIRLVHMPG
jgi:transcriptional regulator with XRE-family HTH domain